jgi:hypothetical protein
MPYTVGGNGDTSFMHVEIVDPIKQSIITAGKLYDMGL